LQHPVEGRVNESVIPRSSEFIIYSKAIYKLVLCKELKGFIVALFDGVVQGALGLTGVIKINLKRRAFEIDEVSSFYRLLLEFLHCHV